MGLRLSELKKAAKENKLTHLLLFYGSGRTERREAVRELALVLNCKGEDPPCKQCSACKKILAGIHPDIHIVEPQKNSIKIEQIIALQEKIYRKNYEGNYRVCLIDEADKLTLPAANALLKIAEEPPAATIIVFSTSNAEGIIDTLRSRSQIIYLPPLTEKDWDPTIKELYSLSGGDSDLARHIQEIGIEKLKNWIDLYLKMIDDRDFLYTFKLFPMEREESLVFLQALTVKIKEKVIKGEYPVGYLTELRKTLEIIRKQVNHRLAIEVLVLKHIKLGGTEIG